MSHVNLNVEENIHLKGYTLNSYVKGYHEYKDIWIPLFGERLQTEMEPTNKVDKYAVCVLNGTNVIGHLKKGKTGRFAKIIFYFLRADKSNNCNIEITGKPVSFGDGDGMQVPCILYFEGLSAYIDILKKTLPDN